jgi:stearoyl-CoA desaturase (delta-9 desaturase)
LARVRRVAPSVSIARDKQVADLETLRAVVRHRYHILTLYGRKVIRPVVKAERRASYGAGRTLLSRVGKLMIREDIALDAHARAALAEALQQSQALETVYRFKAQLKTLWTHTANDGSKRMERLETWCAEAERSGIKALQDFVAVLRGYTFQAT